jgi:hypothetical protein
MAESGVPDTSLATTPRPVRRRLIIVGGAVIIVAAVIGILFWRHQADVNARRADAQQHLNLARKQQAKIQALWKQYDNLVDSYNRAEDDAHAAGHRRHDSHDESFMLVQAKKELVDVETMQANTAARRGSLDSLADAYAEALGDSSVSGFRSSAGQFVQMVELGLTRWWRAIGEIVDSVNGTDFPSENIAQLYDESSDYQTRARTQSDQLMHQSSNLDKQVQARIDAAKQNLAAIR